MASYTSVATFINDFTSRTDESLDALFCIFFLGGDSRQGFSLHLFEIACFQLFLIPLPFAHLKPVLLRGEGFLLGHQGIPTMTAKLISLITFGVTSLTGRHFRLEWLCLIDHHIGLGFDIAFCFEGSVGGGGLGGTVVAALKIQTSFLSSSRICNHCPSSSRIATEVPFLTLPTIL